MSPKTKASSIKNQTNDSMNNNILANNALIQITDIDFSSIKATNLLKKNDPIMKKIIQKVGPFGLEIEFIQNTYESLFESIVYQQLTGKAASTILRRVKEIYGSSIKFPKPQKVLETEDQILRKAGLSNAKTLAIKDLAAKAESKSLPTINQLKKMSDLEIIDSLTSIRGIGVWTVQMLLIFRLGRPNILPTTDYGVRKAYAKFYGKEELPSQKELELASLKWQPYCSIATWYLWRSLEIKNE